jgi:hypothetical protein
MKAKVKTPFAGALDGDVYPRDFLRGDEITGDLARTAVAAGTAEILEDDSEEEKAALAQRSRRVPHPMPPQPNNPPSPAALGQAGLPPQPQAFSEPRAGSEAAVAATATADLGASQVEGPDTPSGGKLPEASREVAAAESEARHGTRRSKHK